MENFKEVITTNMLITEKTIKVSQYSFFIPRDDGSLMVFNSLSGTIIHIDDESIMKKLGKILDENMNESFLYNSEDELHTCFYEGGIFVDSDINEYEYVMYNYEQNVVRNNALTLILITSRQCNLRCVYCYEEHENKNMSDEVYGNLLALIQNSLASRSCSSINISLFGGEPFVLFDNIVRFLTSAKSICAEYNVPFKVGATTNFALINPERFEVLSKLNCSFYQVTVDGLSTTHDKYRPNIGGTGSFDTIVKNLKYARDTSHDFNIVIRTNFNSEITGYAKEFYSFIKEEFSDPRFSVHFESIKKLGGENDETLDILDDEDIDSDSVKIAKLVSTLGIKNSASEFFTQPFQGVCYASKHNTFVIDYDGSIRKCTVMLDSDKNKVGTLLNIGQLKIEHLQHSSWVCKKCKISDECQECKIFPICFGGRCVARSINGKDIPCNRNAKIKNVENMVKYII